MVPAHAADETALATGSGDQSSAHRRPFDRLMSTHEYLRGVQREHGSTHVAYTLLLDRVRCDMQNCDALATRDVVGRLTVYSVEWMERRLSQWFQALDASIQHIVLGASEVENTIDARRLVTQTIEQVGQTWAVAVAWTGLASTREESASRRVARRLEEDLRAAKAAFVNTVREWRADEASSMRVLAQLCAARSATRVQQICETTDYAQRLRRVATHPPRWLAHHERPEVRRALHALAACFCNDRGEPSDLCHRLNGVALMPTPIQPEARALLLTAWIGEHGAAMADAQREGGSAPHTSTDALDIMRQVEALLEAAVRLQATRADNGALCTLPSHEHGRDGFATLDYGAPSEDDALPTVSAALAWRDAAIRYRHAAALMPNTPLRPLLLRAVVVDRVTRDSDAVMCDAFDIDAAVAFLRRICVDDHVACKAMRSTTWSDNALLHRLLQHTQPSPPSERASVEASVRSLDSSRATVHAASSPPAIAPTPAAQGGGQDGQDRDDVVSVDSLERESVASRTSRTSRSYVRRMRPSVGVQQAHMLATITAALETVVQKVDAFRSQTLAPTGQVRGPLDAELAIYSDDVQEALRMSIANGSVIDASATPCDVDRSAWLATEVVTRLMSAIVDACNKSMPSAARYDVCSYITSRMIRSARASVDAPQGATAAASEAGPGETGGTTAAAGEAAALAVFQLPSGRASRQIRTHIRATVLGADRLRSFAAAQLEARMDRAEGFDAFWIGAWAATGSSRTALGKRQSSGDATPSEG